MYRQESVLSTLVDSEPEDPASQHKDSIKIVYERSSLDFQTVHKTLLQESRTSNDCMTEVCTPFFFFAIAVTEDRRGIKIG